MGFAKTELIVRLVLSTATILGFSKIIIGAPAFAQASSEVSDPLLIPDLFVTSDILSLPRVMQIPGPPSKSQTSTPFNLSPDKTRIDSEKVGEVQNFIQQGNRFFDQKLYQQASGLYGQAQELLKDIGFGQNQCEFQANVVKDKSSNNTTVSGGSSSNGNGTSVNVQTSSSSRSSSSSSSTITHTSSNSQPFNRRNDILSSYYDLGKAYFRLAQVSGNDSLLERSKILITKVAQELGVFTHRESTIPGQQSFLSTDSSATFQVLISSEQSTSSSSACVTNSDYTLEAKIFHLLEQVYLAQKNTDEALKVSEAGRTIQVDKTIAYNLSRSGNEKLSQIAKDLSRGLTLDDIKQLSIDEKATIVSYSTDSALAPTKVYIWVIRGGQIHHSSNDLNKISFDQLNLANLATSEPNRGKMQALLRGTRTTLKNGSLTQGEYQKSEEILYQLLIAPIEKWLPKNPDEHVVFVPHDALFFVPFPALRNPSTGQYLIDNHTIRTAPNLRSLKLSREKRPMQNGKVLVVGNPKTSRDDLKGAEKEANVIAKLFKAKQRDVDILLTEDATRKNVISKMRGSEIIHLAAHGILDTDTPVSTENASNTLSMSSESDFGSLLAQAAAQISNLSGSELLSTTRMNSVGFGRSPNSENALKLFAGAIALTPQGGDDGLLTASEILSMDLKANLVVLSACDTGRGPLTAGGVIGLPLSLSLAQVPNIMVSLWAVPDTPTSQLMEEFYNQLLKDPSADKAKALREAMLNVKKMENGKYKAPVNWAAFTLMGTSN
jgi:CHAT domain-containing protein